MVLPKYNLSYTARDKITYLTSKVKENINIDAYQAKEVLKHSIITTLKRVRVFNQLRFIQTCIQKQLPTNKVYLSTQQLKLKGKQQDKLCITMMRNIRNELYNKLTTNYKCEKDSFNNVKEILNPDYIQCFIDVKNNEKEFAADRTKKHFDDRLKWIIEKKEERLSKAIPDIIDGIDMRDKDVPTTYDIEPKIYGGVKIDSNEAAVLKLPPKFSRIYKPDKLDFKANLEKTFNKIRWNKQINEQNHEGSVVRNINGFYD